MDAAFDEGGFCHERGETFVETVKRFLTESKHVFEAFDVADEWVASATKEDIEARLTELQTLRQEWEEQLYDDTTLASDELTAEVRHELDVIWAEILTLEDAMASLATSITVLIPSTKQATQKSGQQGIVSHGDDTDKGSKKPSPELEETWKEREQKAEQYEKDPLSV